MDGDSRLPFAEGNHHQTTRPTHTITGLDWGAVEVLFGATQSRERATDGEELERRFDEATSGLRC
jgi:hypothetical protein